MSPMAVRMAETEVVAETVIFEVDEGSNTLNEFRHKRKYSAQDGQEGGKKRCHGADGKRYRAACSAGEPWYMRRKAVK